MKKGLTLIEVLVSAFILAITAAGLVNLFVTSKRYLAATSSRMSGAELGKTFLDPLQNQVRLVAADATSKDGWDEEKNLLKFTIGQPYNEPQGTPIIQNGVTYTPHYKVYQVIDPSGNDTGLRRVVVRISWPQIN